MTSSTSSTDDVATATQPTTSVSTAARISGQNGVLSTDESTGGAIPMVTRAPKVWVGAGIAGAAMVVVL